jgi:hypothetical protein
MPPDHLTSDALSTRGYGLTTEREPYLRYGPNTSQSRGNEEALGRHASRHVDQWAVATVAGGPLAFPVAYALDGAFFPGPQPGTSVRLEGPFVRLDTITRNLDSRTPLVLLGMGAGVAPLLSLTAAHQGLLQGRLTPGEW